MCSAELFRREVLGMLVWSVADGHTVHSAVETFNASNFGLVGITCPFAAARLAGWHSWLIFVVAHTFVFDLACFDFAPRRLLMPAISFLRRASSAAEKFFGTPLASRPNV